MTPSDLDRLRGLMPKGPLEPLLKPNPDKVYCALHALADDSGSTEFDAPYPLLSDLTGLTYEAVRRSMDRLYEYGFVIRITNGAGTHTGYRVRLLSLVEAAAARQGQANVIAMPTRRSKPLESGITRVPNTLGEQECACSSLLEPLFVVCLSYFDHERLKEVRDQIRLSIIHVATWFVVALRDSRLHRPASQPGFLITVLTSVLLGESPLHKPQELANTRHSFKLALAEIEANLAKRTKREHEAGRAKRTQHEEVRAARAAAEPSQTA